MYFRAADRSACVVNTRFNPGIDVAYPSRWEAAEEAVVGREHTGENSAGSENAKCLLEHPPEALDLIFAVDGEALPSPHRRAQMRR
jgi:hypothetical protein